MPHARHTKVPHGTAIHRPTPERSGSIYDGALSDTHVQKHFKADGR